MYTAYETIENVDKKELEEKVKLMFKQVALKPDDKYHFEIGRNLAEKLGYDKEILDKIPADSINSFAGVGYCFDMADIREDQTIVDLGSGSGMDVFYASELTGDKGTITGIDFTPEQLDKANSLSIFYNIGNTGFRNGNLEYLPLPAGIADVVISNGVINLCADKEKVFQEAARILKPGGQLAVSDIVSQVSLPRKISCNASLWASCIGGALQIDEYYTFIEKAGFRISYRKTNKAYQFLSRSAINAADDYGVRSISLLAIKNQ